MMNGHLLHKVGGAKGEGLLIGILDAGYQNADVLPGLATSPATAFCTHATSCRLAAMCMRNISMAAPCFP